MAQNFIDPSAKIGANCVIADSAKIGANCVIGDNVKIGENCEIGAGVTIGKNCEIGAGVTIGIGSTIGAGVTIGTGSTIGDGVKIANRCKIGDNNEIWHGCLIGGSPLSINDPTSYSLVIGNGNKIHPMVFIYGNTKIGDGNEIWDCCIIGLPSQHIGYHRYPGKVIIGNNNDIRSRCQIDAGNNYGSREKPELLDYITEKRAVSEDVTEVGDNCSLLNCVTVHHNCHVGLGDIPGSRKKEYNTVICANCCLNGFVHVYKGCELSSGTFVREWMAIGPGGFTAMAAKVVKNVPPFMMILEHDFHKMAYWRMREFGLDPVDISSIAYYPLDSNKQYVAK